MSIPLDPRVKADIIHTNGWFTENGHPAVYWQLNQGNGLLSLIEARARAQALFQAVAYAEGEAAIMRGMLHLHGQANRTKPKGFGVVHQEKAEIEALTMAAQLREFVKKGRSPLLEGLEVIFGLKTRKALINCYWYGELAQWETLQAIEHATILIETAEAAESDAHFRVFLSEKCGISEIEAYPMIAEFQTFRQRRQLEELFKGGNA